MLAFLLALAVAPWSHPLYFQPLAGWQTGSSGYTRSAYIGHARHIRVPLESTAWIATDDVRFRDEATADPPNQTLKHLSRNSILIWAVISSPVARDEQPIRLNLQRARRLPCCEGELVQGGDWELTGTAAGGYPVIVRCFFGSHPNATFRAKAQRALNHLVLPAPR